MSHKGRSYVIFGATGSVGSALARMLASDDARVTVVGRDETRIHALAEEIGGQALTADAADFSAVESAFESALDWADGVDGAVNCAGSILLKPAHLTSAKEFEDVIAANLTTAMAVVRGAGKAMKKGGSVVLVSSAAARIGMANHEGIAAAKGGVVGLTLAAAATYARKNIRFNAVAPGLVQSNMTERIVSNETALKSSLAMHPLGRIGAPEDVASLISMLLGPQSEWVTGQVIGVDGGLADIKTRAAG